uniref:Uncharacterized protein n=1 Tax=Anopheles maculatus TaxID=74869 RepID=A0A182SPA9_9DIPT
MQQRLCSDEIHDLIIAGDRPTTNAFPALPEENPAAAAPERCPAVGAMRAITFKAGVGFTLTTTMMMLMISRAYAFLKQYSGVSNEHGFLHRVYKQSHRGGGGVYDNGAGLHTAGPGLESRRTASPYAA